MIMFVSPLRGWRSLERLCEYPVFCWYQTTRHEHEHEHEHDLIWEETEELTALISTAYDMIDRRWVWWWPVTVVLKDGQQTADSMATRTWLLVAA
jgi:hypothetical protein